MSHYEFLLLLEDVCFIHAPVYYEDGIFSVLVEEADGFYGIDLLFDKDGNIIRE